ncbi:MAG: hypothetical protein IID39_00660, partial [Planctomycetes bacterium]|nr:hypothetical protein [Planctomycetota bacterium]
MSRKTGQKVAILGALTVAGALHVGAAPAEPLAERLPGQSVLYVEWAGWDAIKNANAATPFGKLLADPAVSKLVDEVLRAARLAIGKKAAAQGQVQLADAGLRVLDTLAHKRVALDVLGVSMTETGPSPEIVLAVDVGANSVEFVKALETLTAGLGGHSPPYRLPPPVAEEVDGYAFKRYALPFAPAIRYGVVDGVFLLTAGEETTGKVLATLKGKDVTVAKDQRFGAAIRTIGTKDRTTCLVAHLDVKTLLSQARRAWEAMSQTQTFPPRVEVILEAAGVNKLESVTLASQIAHGGYRHSMFVALPSDQDPPRWMKQAPVSDAQLAMIPKDATLAKAANFRLSDFYDDLMHVLEALGSEVSAPVLNAQAMAEAKMGLRIKKDILDLLDDGWVVYDAPSNGGLFFTGVTLIVEAKDAEGVSNLLKRLVGFVDAQVGPGVARVERIDYRNHAVYYVSITDPPLPIAPAWGVYGRQVIVAFYPQMVMRCIDHLSSKGASKSILDNPDFVRGRKLLPPDASMIAYVDTKAAMEDLYRVLLPLATVGCAFAQGEGVPINASMIPRQETFA